MPCVIEMRVISQEVLKCHNGDVIMDVLASQITSLTIVYSNVYLGAGQRIHQRWIKKYFVILFSLPFCTPGKLICTLPIVLHSGHRYERSSVFHEVLCNVTLFDMHYTDTEHPVPIFTIHWLQCAQWYSYSQYLESLLYIAGQWWLCISIWYEMSCYLILAMISTSKFHTWGCLHIHAKRWRLKNSAGINETDYVPTELVSTF